MKASRLQGRILDRNDLVDLTAAVFYRAVPGDPIGVVRRRHFRWRGDALVGVDDEVLDTAAAARDGLVLVGEGALLAALAAPRTGRMTDVVATIQAEQAILFVGLNATFRRYVEEVVPSLGEDPVVLASPAGLGPDVPVGRPDRDAAARVKGDGRMVAVLAKAVAARERVPKREVAIPCGRYVLRLEHDDLRRTAPSPAVTVSAATPVAGIDGPATSWVTRLRSTCAVCTTPSW